MQGGAAASVFLCQCFVASGGAGCLCRKGHRAGSDRGAVISTVAWGALWIIHRAPHATLRIFLGEETELPGVGVFRAEKLRNVGAQRGHWFPHALGRSESAREWPPRRGGPHLPRNGETSAGAASAARDPLASSPPSFSCPSRFLIYHTRLAPSFLAPLLTASTGNPRPLFPPTPRRGGKEYHCVDRRAVTWD